MLPHTFEEFLAWLGSAAGLSLATSLVVGAVIRGWPPAWPLGDGHKRVIGLAVPVLLVLAGYGTQVLLAYVPASIDGLYQALVLALQLAAGGQLVYQVYKLKDGNTPPDPGPPV